MLALIQPPSVKIKFLFWVILGIISTSLAEVLAGSMPFPLFTLWGWLATIPLYTLHILVLGTLAIKYRPSFYRLYLFGVLFGLYEAYITKVLWTPPWDPFLLLNGVAVIETIVLILFWHPIISFILPLILVDLTMSKTPILSTVFPNWLSNFLSRHFYLLTLFYAVLFGISHSLGLNMIWSVLASICLLISIGGLLLFWKKVTRNEYIISELLPNKFQTLILAFLLVILYIILGMTLRIEFLPGIQTQAVIWAIYIFIVTLIFLESKQSQIYNSPIPFILSRAQKFIVVTLFLIVSAVAPLLGSNFVTIISTVANWTIAIIVGSVILTLSIKRVINLK